MNLPKIGISIGDLNGIGIEIIMKTFADERMFKYCIPIVYGSGKAMAYHRNVLEMESFRFNNISSTEHAKPDTLNVINCWEDAPQINVGTANAELGNYALKALEAVAYDAIEKKIDAIVTAPVNKGLINTDAQPFTGQTEFFTNRSQAPNSLMLMTADHVRVGLVSNHLPISDVASSITKEAILKKLSILNRSLKQDYLIVKPKIAVLSLNPHAGDNGTIGKEDDEIVRPAIEQAKQEKLLVFGPFPADSFFGSGDYASYDAVLAMYHDQGLVPFKTLSFGEGVNVTAGLPIVRTSPDHGTAFDIAGKNIADPSSFRQAIFEAIAITKNRTQHAEMHANPVKKHDPSKLRENRDSR